MGEREKLSDEEIQERMEQLEKDPPEKLEDWPEELEVQMRTFGGPEGTHSYAEGVEERLGPSDTVHHEDGSVTVKGEEVDNPEDFKGERIEHPADDPEMRGS